MRHRVAVLMGTRPEAIKLAPVVAALAASDRLEPIVINTGQHRELIDQVISLFGIHVHRDLAVMQPNQTLASLTARLLTALDETLVSLDPRMVLVQGDTTTVLSGALAAFYRRVPVGHVEAGLRTGNLASPFPEEGNRVLTTPLAALHFAPTERSRDNLLAERVDPATIHVTGNTVIDALQMERQRQSDPGIGVALRTGLCGLGGADLFAAPMVLVTGHRRENFGGGFQQICDAIARLAARFPATLFVYPVHLNPNVREVVHERLGGLANVRLLPPQPYSEFVALLAASHVVLTDSGGVQEEAPSLGKPVLVMRDTTERPEGVDAGTVRLVGPVADAIVNGVSELLTDEAAYRRMAEAQNPYGDGHAAERIVAACEAFLG
ncbi:non-hydrolyzing UDP-N-acetylglucosamine 2-epimerase [Botrimarina hoheduenensis]|uniref:UDP-N-acetylglucosamine 2-epimerase (non-hydrolyzing) n=1 Tax=Botrimarina hoheduenensis TaxID=2528000 RepID=A0A5C5WBH1_9BACT|nr:UDP-N-acetylglucosamine 2-epimerase (non-hydrolyzing) [Botrimarina hoheduenensis]TWT47371.1 UDP-N-acetylglucosamine 2-epimerase [Botrimarina hoheduenensis]